MSNMADAQHTLRGTKTTQRVESARHWGFLPAKWLHLVLTGKHQIRSLQLHISPTSCAASFTSLTSFFHLQHLVPSFERNDFLEEQFPRQQQQQKEENKLPRPPLAACLTGWRSKWTEIISQKTQMSRFDSSCWKPCFHFPEVCVCFPEVAGSSDTGTRQQWPNTHSDLYVHI